MKLLKKLLPLATIATVAGVIVPMIASCNVHHESDPEPEPDKPFISKWIVNGSDTEPEDWSTQYSAQVPAEDEPSTNDYTREYFTAVKKDMNILAGDIACSYYSFLSLNNSAYTQKIKQVNVTINSVDVEHCTASYIIENIPLTGVSDPVEHTKIAISNIPYIASHIYVTQGGSLIWDGWAVEPIPWVIYGDVQRTYGENAGRAAEVEYLNLDGGWSASYTNVDSGVTLSWDFHSEIGTWGGSDSSTLYFFMQNFIHEWTISFRSHYLELWNEE